MALPSLSAPEFITTVPSTGEEIKYRPFLVKEEKILLMALEGNDQNEITNAIMKILSNCVLSNVDIKKLATFDIEYLFLKLRGKSVGEVIEIKVGHTNPDNPCKHRTELEINIDEIQVVGDKPNDKIQLDESIGVKLRFAGMNDISDVDTESSSDLFKMIAGCIEYVYDQENVYGEFSQKEMETWLEQLSSEQFSKITAFFNDSPKLQQVVKWKCPECGEEDEMTLEGLAAFFM
jgi:hypothetical protein